MQTNREEIKEKDSGLFGTGYWTSTVTKVKITQNYVLNNRLGAVYESS